MRSREDKRLEEYCKFVSEVDTRLREVYDRKEADRFGFRGPIRKKGLDVCFLYGGGDRAHELRECLEFVGEEERLELVSKILGIYQFDHQWYKEERSKIALKAKEDFFGRIKGSYGDRIIGTIAEEDSSTLLRIWHDFPYLLKPGQADSMGRGVLFEVRQICDYEGKFGLDKYIETLMPSHSYQTARFPSGVKVRMPSVSR